MQPAAGRKLIMVMPAVYNIYYPFDFCGILRDFISHGSYEGCSLLNFVSCLISDCYLYCLISVMIRILVLLLCLYRQEVFLEACARSGGLPSHAGFSDATQIYLPAV